MWSESGHPDNTDTLACPLGVRINEVSQHLDLNCFFASHALLLCFCCRSYYLIFVSVTEQHFVHNLINLFSIRRTQKMNCLIQHLHIALQQRHHAVRTSHRRARAILITRRYAPQRAVKTS